MRTWCWAALIAAWLTASGPGPAQEVKADPLLARKALDILRKHCSKCHGPDSTGEGNMRYILDARELVAKKKVISGDPVKSRLLKLVRAGEMPPEEEKGRPSKEEIALLEQWVKAGALPPADRGAGGRTFLTEKETLTAILAHLRRLPAQDRPFQRYITLTNLHNSKTVTETDLRLYRAAVSKLLNSLSWQAELIRPEPVDASQTVLAVDLRKLGWDREKLWAALLRPYPYGLKHDRIPDDEAVNARASEIYHLTETEIPAVRADWLVATASRPPLYHLLLRLPRQARDLERQLRVDVAANFQRDRLARAGFATSGVSGQNRLIERHQAAHGAYWKSYDFKSNDGPGNLFRLPLGPVFADNPYPQHAFQHDGGEIIFNLPNGLQGYLLVNGKDERIDEGPIEVVSDGLKTSGTAKIVNGLSCLACHDRGMKSEFTDTVRNSTPLGGDLRDKLRRLYPKDEDIKRMVRQDEERFLAAWKQAAGPFLQVAEAREKDIKDFPEPIGALARMYLLRELGLVEAATELGLTDPKLLQVAIQTNDYLRRQGLGPLATGATIKREVWESKAKFNSPFQEAAYILGRGTPKNERHTQE
jgi:serine/threonine-protein kinase